LVLTSDLATDLAALARGAAGEGWSVVAAGNSDALSSAVGGLVALLKRNRSGLLLAPQSMTEGDLIGIRLNRGIVGSSGTAGRGYLHLGDGFLVTVQVPNVAVSDIVDPSTPSPEESA
jgi:DNA segregation ATPase FtsK/SpoIIIE, S-DNA-T family